MDKKKIILNVLNEKNSDAVKTAEELEKMLDAELAKPEDEIDFELVDQLAMGITEARGNKVIEVDAEEKLAELKRKNIKKKKSSRWKKFTAAVAACLVLVAGNAYTINAYGENLFSLLVTVEGGGLKVHFNQEEELPEDKLPFDADPYGMKAKCAEYGVYPDTPFYIPDGFELDDFTVTEFPEFKYLTFRYRKVNTILIFSFRNYYDLKDIKDIDIISDEHNYSKIDVCGTTGIVSKEKNSLNHITNQYTLVYNKENIVYKIGSDGLDYDECDRIVASLRPNHLKGGEKNEEDSNSDSVVAGFMLPFLSIAGLCR